MTSARSNRYLRDIPLPGLDAGPRGYRGPAVCKLVGITYRQLDYWTTTGLVAASVRSAEGSGSQRLYGFDDIVRLKVIKRLLDTGIALQRIRSALDYVADRGLSLGDVTLVSNGSTVHAVDDDAQIIDLLRSGQGVFAIDVHPVVGETEGEVSALRSEPILESPDTHDTHDTHDTPHTQSADAAKDSEAAEGAEGTEGAAATG